MNKAGSMSKSAEIKAIFGLETGDFLKHAGGKAEQTIRQIEKAIQRYEAFTDYADFQTFDQQRAMGFKADLASRKLAKATVPFGRHRAQALLRLASDAAWLQVEDHRH
jgi:hypothetical protein